MHSRFMFANLFIIIFLIMQTLIVSKNLDVEANLKIVFLLITSSYLVSNTKYIAIEDFIHVVARISFVSLLMYVLINVFPIMRSLCFQVTSDSGQVYETLMLWNIRDTDPFLHRNYGIYREPGINALVSGYALLLSLFVSRVRKFDLLTLLLAVTSTFSSLGFITILTYLFATILRSKSSQIKFVSTLAITLCGILAYQNYLEKTTGLNTSTALRITSIYIDGRIFVDNLLFGVGIGQYSDEVRKVASADYFLNMGSGFSTITKALAMFGVSGFLIILNHYRCFIKITKNRLDVLIVSTVLTVALMSQDYLVSLFFFMLSYPILSSRTQKKVGNN